MGGDAVGAGAGGAATRTVAGAWDMGGEIAPAILARALALAPVSFPPFPIPSSPVPPSPCAVPVPAAAHPRPTFQNG